MKPYLVDVPVRVNIWIRPECQKKQFDVIRKARPSILFLISDGGHNEKEWAAIRANRNMIEKGIDWECTIYKLYEQSNQGMYTMGYKCRSLIWSKVDRCIFLEDDVIPSVSFFQYCEELLEKYKDDLRINTICGMNHLGVHQGVHADYFFSRQGCIWGIATWKRVQEQYDRFQYKNDAYVMRLLKQRMKRNPAIWKRTLAYAGQKYYEGHPAATEFFIEFDMYAQHQLQIVPKVNLISNMGCTSNAAHSMQPGMLPKGLRRVFCMKTYEMAFPMKHPEYVMPDVEYEKKRNRILAYNCPFRAGWRKVETVFLKIRYRDFAGVWQTLVRQVLKIQGRQKIEN